MVRGRGLGLPGPDDRMSETAPVPFAQCGDGPTAYMRQRLHNYLTGSLCGVVQTRCAGGDRELPHVAPERALEIRLHVSVCNTLISRLVGRVLY